MTTPANTTVQRTYTLAQYFRGADLLREAFRRETPSLESPVKVREMFVGPGGSDLAPAWLYLRTWYASLYVVVEGWQEIGLADTEVDQALNWLEVNDEIRILRRFRNAVFHFPKELADIRIVDLLLLGAASNTLRRVNELHGAFGSYFLRWRAEADLSQADEW